MVEVETTWWVTSNFFTKIFYGRRVGREPQNEPCLNFSPLHAVDNLEFDSHTQVANEVPRIFKTMDSLLRRPMDVGIRKEGIPTMQIWME